MELLTEARVSDIRWSSKLKNEIVIDGGAVN